MTREPLPPLARRTVLKGAGLGVGAGLVSGLTSAAHAQTAGAGVAQGEDGPIWSAEYWAKKGDVSLNPWRKRVGAPKPGEPPLPLLFLVHGSSNSARSSYDLTISGKGEYSLMNVFARYGYDVWTMDHDGYGYSGSSGNNSDIASSVEDLKAAIPVVARETGQSKMHFYGTSSGAIRAAAYAQVEPARVDRLVLVAFTYKGTGAPGRGLPQQQPPTARRRHDPLDLHPRRPRRELRPGGARGHRRHGAQVRRPGADRHLSRHGRPSSTGRTEEGAVAGAHDPGHS